MEVCLGVDLIARPRKQGMDELDEFDCHIVPASFKPGFLSDEDFEKPNAAAISSSGHGLQPWQRHGTAFTGSEFADKPVLCRRLRHPASQPILGQVREYDRSSQHPHTCHHIDPTGVDKWAAGSSVEPIIREDSIKGQQPPTTRASEQRGIT